MDGESMNLTMVLKEIRKKQQNFQEERDNKIKEITKLYNNKIMELETAYKVNYDMNTGCLQCDGQGRYNVGDGGYESRSHKERCLICDGTGFKKPENYVSQIKL
jgi:uncharacterized Fe-S center protein